MTVYWGPNAYPETDTDPVDYSLGLLKSIPIDGATLPTDALALHLAVVAGEVLWYEVGQMYIYVGGTASGFDGTPIWHGNPPVDGFGGGWSDLVALVAFLPIAAFTNPNPSGTFYLKFFGQRGSGASPSDPAGLRNYTLQIESDAAPPASPGPPGGGAGQEEYGDPYGAGGPISVVRAIPVDGRTVRVVFDEAPVFRTPAGPFDAMNPSLYGFSVDAGTATAPVATVVSPVLVEGPARGVGNAGATDERGVDVSVDRALIAGITYRVEVRDVQAALGGLLGAPYSAPFYGVVRLQEARVVRGRPRTNVDYGNDPFQGSWRADDSGDIAPQDAEAGFRKRVFRRLLTFRDSFAFLKGYGVAARLKELASLAEVAALKVDIERQIAHEPETAAVVADTSISGLNILTVVVRVKTKVGAFVEVGMRLDLAGGGVQPF